MFHLQKKAKYFGNFVCEFDERRSDLSNARVKKEFDFDELPSNE